MQTTQLIKGEEKGYFYANTHFPRRGQREGATGGEMNLFKQMNSNEALQTRRLESPLCCVCVREREGPDFPAGKNSAQKSPEREGEKNKRRTLEKVSREEEWSSNERGGTREGGGRVQGCIQT